VASHAHDDGCGGAEAAQGFAGARAHAVCRRALRRLLHPRRLRRQQVRTTPSAPPNPLASGPSPRCFCLPAAI